jgi:hypothetical protein
MRQLTTLAGSTDDTSVEADLAGTSQRADARNVFTSESLNALQTIPRCIGSIDVLSTNVQALFTIMPPE